MTYETLLAMAKDGRNKTYQTASGQEFRIDVFNDCPFFIPSSSGLGRSDGRRAAERFVERFNETGSPRPADYRDVTRNASYFLALIASTDEWPSA